MIGIYKVTNLINQKVYIGQSDNIELRWKKHRTRSIKNYGPDYNCVFYKAIRKYGIENFKFEVIEECSKNDLNQREKYWIKQYNSYLGFKNCNGYNMTLGGQNSYAHTLSYNDVIVIQDKLLNTRITQEDIGKEFNVSQVTISQINQGLIWVNEELTYPLRNKKYVNNYCIDCGVAISRTATRCIKCQSIQNRSIDRPTREELKQMIRKIPFTKIGKQYNISDNGIRKWCDSYGLPRKSSIIKKYSNEEWERI